MANEHLPAKYIFLRKKFSAADTYYIGFTSTAALSQDLQNCVFANSLVCLLLSLVLTQSGELNCCKFTLPTSPPPSCSEISTEMSTSEREKAHMGRSFERPWLSSLMHYSDPLSLGCPVRFVTWPLYVSASIDSPCIIEKGLA
jgi:hypothetical protein